MGQLNLFGSPSPEWEEIPLLQADVRLMRRFLSEPEASALLDDLKRQVPWRADKIVVYGKEHNLPRLQQWYGDAGLTYVWSGIVMTPETWHPALLQVKERVESTAHAVFNTVLLNYYRDGNDTVAWHTDDEPELGEAPVIASVSLGAERDFQLRPRAEPSAHPTSVALPHGSLLVMAGATQRCWLHALPRRKGIRDARINLTFRRMLRSAPRR